MDSRKFEKGAQGAKSNRRALVTGSRDDGLGVFLENLNDARQLHLHGGFVRAWRVRKGPYNQAVKLQWTKGLVVDAALDIRVGLPLSLRQGL